MILVKYHTLFFRKFRKMLKDLSFAAVMIGALRVKGIEELERLTLTVVTCVI